MSTKKFTPIPKVNREVPQLALSPLGGEAGPSRDLLAALLGSPRGQVSG